MGETLLSCALTAALCGWGTWSLTSRYYQRRMRRELPRRMWR